MATPEKRLALLAPVRNPEAHFTRNAPAVDVYEADWRTALRAAVVTTEARMRQLSSGCALIECLSAHNGDPVELHDGQSA